jgi:hypothetical protein
LTINVKLPLVDGDEATEYARNRSIAPGPRTLTTVLGNPSLWQVKCEVLCMVCVCVCVCGGGGGGPRIFEIKLEPC